MAKRKMARNGRNGGLNRAAVIRDLKASNPSMGPKEMAEKLTAAHNSEFTPQYISTILSSAKRNPPSGKRGRRPAGAKSGRFEVKTVLAVSDLVKKYGAAEVLEAARLIQELQKP